MVKVMFVCHGNICRSPMAEFVLKDMVKKAGFENKFRIASSATSTEEIGNSVHYGTKEKLLEHGISTDGKRSIQLKKSDYDEYDYLIAMDDYNIKNIKRIIKNDPEHKISKLLSFAGKTGDIADPWYTGNFDITYDDVYKGCAAFLNKVLNESEVLV